MSVEAFATRCENEGRAWHLSYDPPVLGSKGRPGTYHCTVGTDGPNPTVHDETLEGAVKKAEMCLPNIGPDRGSNYAHCPIGSEIALAVWCPSCGTPPGVHCAYAGGNGFSHPNRARVATGLGAH